MQKHNHAMLIAKLGQRPVEALNLLTPLIIGNWISARVRVCGQALNAVACQLALINGMDAGACEAPPLVDEKVIHDAAQPRPGLFDARQLVNLAVGLDEQLLKKVFRLSLAAGEPPCESIQPLEMRPHKTLKSQIVVCRAHQVVECSAPLLADKDTVGSFGGETAATLEVDVKQEVVIDQQCGEQEAKIGNRKLE